MTPENDNESADKAIGLILTLADLRMMESLANEYVYESAKRLAALRDAGSRATHEQAVALRNKVQECVRQRSSEIARRAQAAKVSR